MDKVFHCHLHQPVKTKILRYIHFYNENAEETTTTTTKKIKTKNTEETTISQQMGSRKLTNKQFIVFGVLTKYWSVKNVVYGSVVFSYSVNSLKLHEHRVLLRENTLHRLHISIFGSISNYNTLTKLPNKKLGYPKIEVNAPCINFVVRSFFTTDDVIDRKKDLGELSILPYPSTQRLHYDTDR